MNDTEKEIKIARLEAAIEAKEEVIEVLKEIINNLNNQIKNANPFLSSPYKSPTIDSPLNTSIYKNYKLTDITYTNNSTSQFDPIPYWQVNVTTDKE